MLFNEKCFCGVCSKNELKSSADLEFQLNGENLACMEILINYLGVALDMTSHDKCCKKRLKDIMKQ